MVTRAACLWVPGTGLTLLLSDLSDHARALVANPACSVLLGGPDDRGDPLTHPRLTLVGIATPADKSALRDAWSEARPKTRLYYDFPDFQLRSVEANGVLLVAGFGKAVRLRPGDLG